MTDLIVKPAKSLTGEISIPGDKSISHRAVMLGALAQGVTKVNDFLMGDDCLATIRCLQQLGAEITNYKLQMTNECQIIVKGNGLAGLKNSKDILNVGNSGTTIRLLSGILAGQSFTTKITGDASIQKRPMMRIVGPLREMGAKIFGQEKKDNIYAPLEIAGGKLTPVHYKLPVASAQVKSAILLAGLFAKGETRVVEKTRARDHTERMLAYLGADIKVEGLVSSLKGGKELQAKEISVPGDISSAAYFIVAALITPDSELTIKNVGTNPTRTGIIDVLKEMGGKIEIVDEQIVSGEPRANIKVQSAKLKAIKISGEIIPRIIDEIPIIAVAASQAEGKTEIRGARELRVKESDRIKTICAELSKFGVKIEELDDGLVIEGQAKLNGAKIKSYGDHRIAMAMAIAGLIAKGQTQIENTDCIETSFPGFAKLLP